MKSQIKGQITSTWTNQILSEINYSLLVTFYAKTMARKVAEKTKARGLVRANAAEGGVSEAPGPDEGPGPDAGPGPGAGGGVEVEGVGAGASDGEEVGVGAGGEEVGAGEEAGGGVVVGAGAAAGGGGGVVVGAGAGAALGGVGVAVGGCVGAAPGACARVEVAKRPKIRNTCSAAEEPIVVERKELERERKKGEEMLCFVRDRKGEK